jgi:DHA2 family methylenomycin A resistance protein-like MFS transporter
VTAETRHVEHLARSRLALAAICTGFFLVLLDTTILNVALPAIGRDFGVGTGDLQWVVNAYTIAFGALLLSGGALSDRLGTLRVYAWGLGAFAVASLLAALAPALGLLVAARALQGVAAAVMVPSSLSLIAHTFPEPRARARAVGIWIGSSGIAASAGPLLGGVLVDWVGWRAVFVVNLPVTIAGMVIGARVIPPVPRGPGRPLDLTGQLLAVVVLVGLSAGFIESGEHAWASPWVWTPLAVGVVSAGLFLMAERRHHDPVLPLALFRGSRFSAANAVGALVNLGYYGQLFVLALYFQEVLGLSPLEAGLAFLPLFGSTFVLSWLAGRMTARSGPARPMAIGLAVGLVGFLLLLPAGADTHYWQMIPALLLVSLGAFIPAPLSVAVIASAPNEQSGTVSGVLNAMRQTGGAIGVAILGSLVASGGFVAGMHEALAVSVATSVISLVLTLAYLRERPRRAPGEAVSAPAG